LRLEEKRRLQLKRKPVACQGSNSEQVEGHQWIIDKLSDLLVAFRRGPLIQVAIVADSDSSSSDTSCVDRTTWDLYSDENDSIEETHAYEADPSLLEKFDMNFVEDDWENLWEEDHSDQEEPYQQSPLSVSRQQPFPDDEEKTHSCEGVEKENEIHKFKILAVQASQTIATQEKQHSRIVLAGNRYSEFLEDSSARKTKYDSVWDACFEHSPSEIVPLKEASLERDDDEDETDGGVQSLVSPFPLDPPDSWESLCDDNWF
ncbi:MAG: hypothetical protein SGARI_008085, partial [Bacillariaceae sp.]